LVESVFEKIFSMATCHLFLFLIFNFFKAKS